MDIAYSTTFQDVIDAERAYDLFQAEIIKNKRAFECPDENCDAQITCVNIDKPIQERKKSVHFRSYGNHSENCPYGGEKLINIPQPGGGKSDRNKLTNVHFLTDRPKDYYTIKKITGVSPEEAEKEKKRRKRNYHETLDYKVPKKHYWIAPLVTHYLKYQDDSKALKNIYIQRRKEVRVAFSDFFIPIKNQLFDSLPKYPSIYFGKAFFNEKTDEEIEIKFASSFCLDGKLIKPALRLKLDAVSVYKNYRYWKKRLDTAITSKPPYLFFIYGMPHIIPWSVDGHPIQYIRFRTKRLDYMDLRIG